MTKNYVLILFFSFFLFFSAKGQNCNAPTGLAVINVTGTSATLAWNPPVTSMQTEIYVTAAAAAPTWEGGLASTSNSYIISGLMPCSSYKFYVRTVCGPNDFSEWAGPFNFFTNSGLACTSTTNGSTITTVVSGGTAPYQYALNGGPPAVSGTGVFTINNAVPGTYMIQVTDANGCNCSSMVTIQNSGFSVTISPTLDIPTSTLTAMVTGGTAPFTYQWGRDGMIITGATGESINVLGSSGVYTVTVTGANGQTATASFFVNTTMPIANDDAFNVYNVNGTFATSANSVLDNDDYQGDTSNSAILTVLNVPAGFTLNPNGTVSVLSGTPSGVYAITYQLCSPFTPGLCDTATAAITVINEGILMNAFIDSNNNGTQEAGEPGFGQGQFGYELNNNGAVNHAFSYNGDYLIYESNPANSYDLTYTINPAVASHYILATSSYSNVSIVANAGIQVYNFPITELPYTDLAVHVVPSGAPPRPGFVYSNRIVIVNSGNQTIASGTVTFNKDNMVTISNVFPSATTTTATGFTYDFINLTPGEVRDVYVTLQVPTIPTVALGNILANNASVTVPVGDTNVTNNSSVLSQVIVGSYDPNDKSESHGGKIVHSAFTSNDYLTYTIQFENTGNFNAENVRIEDNLDPALDETSIKMLNASHGYTLNRSGNHLDWSFTGIDLPPSVANTTTGKGYVSFQVKPKAGYAVGDIIPNTASIFFDFNPAIVTNTFNTEFVTSLSVAEFDNAAFIAYPNPTANSITVSLKNSAGIIDVVTVNDISGKTVQSDAVYKAAAVLDLSRLSQGIYFLKIQSEGQEKVMKVVKQ